MSKRLLLVVFIFLMITQGSFAADYDLVKVGLVYGPKAETSYLVSGQDLHFQVTNDLALPITSQELVVTSTSLKNGLMVGPFQEISAYLEAKTTISQNFPVYDLANNGAYLLIDFPSQEAQKEGINLLMASYQLAPILANESLLVYTTQGEKFYGKQGYGRVYSLDGLVHYEGASYRGSLYGHSKDGKINLINELTVQEYLQGVLPKEMSGSWPLEALRAQALAARTYYYNQQGKHASEGFDVCSTTDCQVYGGASVETEQTNLAIALTADEIITYNGEPISAYYHSNSGGFTANSENVWVEKIPYLRGVYDPYSIGAPNTNWTYELSEDKFLNEMVSAGYPLTRIDEVKILSTSPFGRVQELLVRGDQSYILKKEQVRRVFGYQRIKSILYEVQTGGYQSVMTADGLASMELGKTSVLTSKGQSTLQGTSFLVKTSSDLVSYTLSKGQIVFKGRGWGHGLGMSQWGAKKMADQGFTGEEIIQFYYNNVSIEKVAE